MAEAELIVSADQRQRLRVFCLPVAQVVMREGSRVSSVPLSGPVSAVPMGCDQIESVSWSYQVMAFLYNPPALPNR